MDLLVDGAVAGNFALVVDGNGLVENSLAVRANHGVEIHQAGTSPEASVVVALADEFPGIVDGECFAVFARWSGEKVGFAVEPGNRVEVRGSLAAASDDVAAAVDAVGVAAGESGWRQ